MNNNKKKRLSAMAGCLVLAIAALPAAAETIYRCGDSYSHKPCAGNTTIDVDDSRSVTQRAQTREASQRDAKAADAMEKARLQEEGKPPQVHVIASRGSDAAKGADAARSAEPKRSALKSARNKAQKAGAPDHFTAIAPGSKKTKPPRKKKA